MNEDDILMSVHIDQNPVFKGRGSLFVFSFFCSWV